MMNNPNPLRQGKELQEFLKTHFGIRCGKKTLPLFELVWRPQIYCDKKNGGNERLSFLGDSILKSVLGEYMFEKFPYGDANLLEDMQERILWGVWRNACRWNTTPRPKMRMPSY